MRNVRSGKYIGLDSNEPRDDVHAIAVDYQYEWDIQPDDEDNTVYRLVSNRKSTAQSYSSLCRSIGFSCAARRLIST